MQILENCISQKIKKAQSLKTWYNRSANKPLSKGVPVKALFTYTLTNVFRMGSFYMQNKLGKIHDGFSKNTYYRFLMSPRTNWLRFTTLLSARIINGHLRDLTSENRKRTIIERLPPDRFAWDNSSIISKRKSTDF